MQKPVDSDKRAVAHFDLDAFFVSVERRLNPELGNKPLIVGWPGGRGVVAACSYETRKFGVHSAMPMTSALRLCPGAVVIPPTRTSYLKFSGMVTDIISRRAPLIEKASIDEFYIEYTGMGDFDYCYERAALLRQEIINRTGLSISFALSANKLVSKIAVDTVKPNGKIRIDPGTEAGFLAPMAVEKIPMVGPETAARLHKMGIFTVAQLAESSKDTLRTFFGKQGPELVDRAKGLDPTPVSDIRKHKSISTEKTFEKDLADKRKLEEEFIRINAQNAFQLKKSNYYTACVAIKIRFQDFETITRQMAISPTASEDQLARYVKRLFRMYYKGNKSVRLIGVRYSNLIIEGFQLDIFID